MLGLIGTAPNLSATVLDTSEDLNNLYRTISRKRILNKVNLLDLQRYPQMMRLQRRLDGIFIFCFLMFIIPFNCKLASIFA